MHMHTKFINFWCSVVLVIFLLLQVKCENHHNFRNKHLADAIAFIDSIQNPKNCEGVEYVVVGMGINGGFAAQFQLAASEWMRVFASVGFSKPVLIVGSLKGYSVGPECAAVNGDWTCFFKPMSTCQETLLKSGKRSDFVSFAQSDEETVPKQFRHLGLAFWWGVVQYKMFRLQPFVETYIMEEAKHMHEGHGFPFGIPIAGMHVRHGDKHVDGFRQHTLSEEMTAVRRSSDCSVQSKAGDCFMEVSCCHTHRNNMLAKALHKKQTVIIVKSEVETYNHTHFPTAIKEEALQCTARMTNVNHKGGDKAGQHALPSSNRRKLEDYNYMRPRGAGNSTMDAAAHLITPATASTGAAAAAAAAAATTSSNTEQSKPNEVNAVNPASVVASKTETTVVSPASSNALVGVTPLPPFITPLHIFVASDDMDVLAAAAKQGYMVDTTGISQHTASDGMLKTLLSHPEYGYNATLEIISDIYFLSQCSSLLGICASQVYRMAVALSNVTGILHYAVAMDMDQMQRVQGLSRKYAIPFPEHFPFQREVENVSC